MSLFPAPPSLELSGPNDVAAIARIRTHYQNVLQIRASLQEQLEEKGNSIEVTSGDVVMNVTKLF